MPTLDVAIPFKLSFPPTNEDGTPRDPSLPHTYVFPVPGIYDANDEVAQHWYTAPHLTGYEEPPPNVQKGVEVMVPAETPPEGGDGETLGGAARGGPIQNRQTDRAAEAKREADRAAEAGRAAAHDTKADTKRG